MYYRTEELKDELNDFLKSWTKAKGNSYTKFAKLSGMGLQQMEGFTKGLRNSNKDTIDDLDKTLRIEQLK